MLLSTSIGHYIKQGYSPKECIDILADSGFDAADFMFTPEFCGENTDDEEFKSSFLELRRYAEENGLVFNQAHAHYPSSSADPATNELYYNYVVRSIRNASYLGVPVIVVHPKQHLLYNEEGNPEKLFEMNMEFYRSLIPYAEKYNIKIAVENMWICYPNRKIWHSTCSKPDEFINYIDTLNSEWIVACLDIGHAVLVCEEPDIFIEKLGHRLAALHVHDVDGFGDTHTIPFFGVVQWDKVIKALSKIGYKGDFTFETDTFIGNPPKEVVPFASKMLAETGRYLINKVKSVD
ncbi:MAG: sugar phosphate isomerase/epimerase [Clostridia bacterium]|nr:sugar phosphate isomerase/epimerase [Clostridia bacterium]